MRTVLALTSVLAALYWACGPGFNTDVISTTSSFSPTEIADLTLWLHADAGAVVKDGGNNVSQLTDQSGNGHDFTQASGALQPDWIAGGLNGENTIEFIPGNNDVLNGPGSVLNSENFTTFIVAKITTVATDAGVFTLCAGAQNWEFPMKFAAATRQFRCNSSTNIAISAAMDDEWRLYSVRRGVSTTNGTEFFFDATSLGFRTCTNTGLFTAMVLGQRTACGPATTFSGQLAEVIFYQRKLDDGEMARVNDYLKKKYALSY